jgi:hypothetical protein
MQPTSVVGRLRGAGTILEEIYFLRFSRGRRCEINGLSGVCRLNEETKATVEATFG